MPKTYVRLADFNVAVDEEIIFLTTKCCMASAKGTANAESGVCCRGCYRELPEFMGWAVLVSDPEAEAKLGKLLREHAALAPEFTAERVLIEARAEVTA